ncbi:MAG TPA: 4-(cytidine 5'-diphospho)-2-C-methyl-D-erythritol kinase [Tepidisphaeraceae bacterium]|jgi:4-diphosphocytidyl-2-C-methyl-D-erythritol kinase
MRIISPAKINLHLRIGPPAADGFHPLLSWMCTVGLHDTIEMENAREPGIRLKCDRPDVPVDGSNLIVRAADAIRNPQMGADITLQKRIPMGGGLGGGSSNAAFALLGLNKLWGLDRSKEQLAKVGAKLGSDIVFFLHGPSSICEGRGERVMPIGRPAPKFAVLIFPKLSMSTPAVYRRFDEMKLGSHGDVEKHPDWQTWRQLPATEFLPLLVNDLEAPAFSLCPELGQLRQQVENQIGQIVRMSGSGSTLFTLADNADAAKALSERIRQPGITVEICELSPYYPEI